MDSDEGSAGLPNAGATGSIDYTGLGGAENGLSMADSMASAEDSLTSAGLAAKDSPDTMSLDQIGASDPSATMARPDEPLIPAAPVPGSIGSVISGPSLQAPEATADSATGGVMAGAAPAAAAAEAAPAGAAAAVVDTAPMAAGAAPAGVSATMAAAPGALDATAPAPVAAMPAVTPTGMVTPEVAAPIMAAPEVASVATVPTMAASEAVSGMAAPGMVAPGMTVSGAAPAAAAANPFTPVTPAMANPSGANGGSANNPGMMTNNQTSSGQVPTALQRKTPKFTPMAGGQRSNTMTIIIAAVAGLAVIAAVVFFILWRKALVDNKEYVYPPEEWGGESVTEPVMMKQSCVKISTEEEIANAQTTMEGVIGGEEQKIIERLDNSILLTSRQKYVFVDNTAAEAQRPAMEVMANLVDMAMSQLSEEEKFYSSAIDIVDNTVTVELVTDITKLGDYNAAHADDEGFEAIEIAIPLDEEDATNIKPAVEQFEALGFTCEEIE